VPLAVLPDWIQTVAVANPVTYAVDAIRALVLGQDVLTVFDTTAFGGIWNTLVSAVAVLVALLSVLAAVAVSLLGHASTAEVQ
jgi:ABC-2 type transport system permease protein